MQPNEIYRRRWAERFGCVLANEFQDVNFAQFTWRRLRCVGHCEVFADDQSVLRNWLSHVLSIVNPD
jgi:DNA helicase II / ATP-dependent DNA helicase PcrA